MKSKEPPRKPNRGRKPRPSQIAKAAIQEMEQVAAEPQPPAPDKLTQAVDGAIDSLVSLYGPSNKPQTRIRAAKAITAVWLGRERLKQGGSKVEVNIDARQGGVSLQDVLRTIQIDKAKGDLT